MALELNGENFKSEVLDSKVPVLVDFWASWCQPCLILEPVIEELSNDQALSKKVKVAKLQIDEAANMKIAEKYEIMTVPNLKLFKEGKIVMEIVGLRSKEAIEEEIEKFIK